MVALKLRKFGNSVGVIFPQATLDALHVDEGDTLYMTSTADGVRLTPFSPEFEAKMTVAQEIMKKPRTRAPTTAARGSPSNPEFEGKRTVAQEIMKKPRTRAP
jgi:putative addiction module antidote